MAGKHVPLSGVRYSIDFRFGVVPQNGPFWWACKFKDIVVSTNVGGYLVSFPNYFGYRYVYAVVTPVTLPIYFQNFYINAILYLFSHAKFCRRERRANEASPLSSPQEAMCYILAANELLPTVRSPPQFTATHGEPL